MQGLEIEKLYKTRFSTLERAKKELIWQVLCKDFFQKWIPENSTVLELAAGYGEFICNIKAANKIAVDLNTETPKLLSKDIKFLNTSALDLSALPDNSIDIVFSSNFFEHLHTKDEMSCVLKESHRVLKKGGRYLSLQPNLKYIGEAYWDFYDHELPLTHLSAKEAFERADFQTEVLFPRFLPYTMKSRIPQSPHLVKLYLKIPLIWQIMGKQFFLVAQKK